jgi:hypothetical protein
VSQLLTGSSSQLNGEDRSLTTTQRTDKQAQPSQRDIVDHILTMLGPEGANALLGMILTIQQEDHRELQLLRRIRDCWAAGDRQAVFLLLSLLTNWEPDASKSTCFEKLVPVLIEHMVFSVAQAQALRRKDVDPDGSAEILKAVLILRTFLRGRRWLSRRGHAMEDVMQACRPGGRGSSRPNRFVPTTAAQPKIFFRISNNRG